MNERVLAASVSMPLVGSNLMRIAGIQGVYGEPNGISIVPIALEDALREDIEEIVLIDGGSAEPLFAVLGAFHERRPLARVVVIGVDQDETYVECVIAAGAKGFIGANASAEEFRYAMLNVREGSLWATRRVLSRLAEAQLQGRSALHKSVNAKFTMRERQILSLLLAGKNNREISVLLGIEEGTVKTHMGRIMRKAGVENRIELTMFAVKYRSSSSRDSQPRRRLLH